MPVKTKTDNGNSLTTCWVALLLLVVVHIAGEGVEAVLFFLLILDLVLAVAAVAAAVASRRHCC